MAHITSQYNGLDGARGGDSFCFDTSVPGRYVEFTRPLRSRDARYQMMVYDEIPGTRKQGQVRTGKKVSGPHYVDSIDIEKYFIDELDLPPDGSGGKPTGGAAPVDPFDDGNRQGPYPNDPLVFDLDGDNSLSVTNAQGGINFDHDGDGFAQLSAWVAQGDGILCIDRNGNGTIDNGLEIFGENMKLSNGSNATSALHALSEFDSDFRVLKLAA